MKRSTLIQIPKEDFIPKFLICSLIVILPLTSVLSNIIGIAGWIKDFICLFLCGYAFLKFRNTLLFISIYPILYSILVIIASIFSGNILDSIRYRCEYAIAFALIFSSIKLKKGDTEKFLKIIISSIFYIGLIVAIVAVIEYFNPSLVHSIYGNSTKLHLSLLFGSDVSNRLLSTMANPINLGLQMAISCSSALSLLFCEKKKKKYRILYFFSIFLFLWVLAFTYSRTAYFVVTLIFFAFVLFKIRTAKILQKVLIIIGGIIFLFFLYKFVMNSSTLSIRIGNINFQEFSNNLRFSRAVEAFTNIDKGIIGYLFGNGIGKAIGESGQYVFEFGYASLVYETGILSLLIFFLVISKAIISGYYILKAENYSMAEKVFISAFLSIICGFGAAMVTEDVYMQLPYNMYLWLSIFIIERIKIDGK